MRVAQTSCNMVGPLTAPWPRADIETQGGLADQTPDLHLASSTQNSEGSNYLSQTALLVRLMVGVSDCCISSHAGDHHEFPYGRRSLG